MELAGCRHFPVGLQTSAAYIGEALLAPLHITRCRRAQIRFGAPDLQIGRLSSNQRFEIREERRHHFEVSVLNGELKHPR